MSSSLLRRRLWTLLAVVAVTGASLAAGRLVEQRYAERAKQKSAAERVLACDGDVVGVELGRGNDEASRIVLAKRLHPGSPYDANVAWRLELPLQASADATTTAALLEAACGLKRQVRIEAKAGEPPLSLPAFGLAPARHVLRLRFADGHEQRLDIGEPSTFDNSLYVRSTTGDANEPIRIDTVDGGFAFQVERDAFSLRDKRLVDLQGAQVSSVEVTAKTQAVFRLVRQSDGEYQIISVGDPNHPLLADRQAVGGWLDSLTSLRAKQFMDEAPAAERLSHFALDPPSFEVLLRLGEASEPVRIRLGHIKLASESHLFGQVEHAGAPIAELEAASIADKLTDGGQSLRDMRLLHCNQADVTRIDIEHHARKLSLVRKPEPNQSEWALDGNEARVDSSRVFSMLYKLTHLRADTLAIEGAQAQELADAGLQAPDVAVRLLDHKGESLGHLRVGAPSAERRAAVGDGERIGQIFASALDGVSSDPADFLVP